MSEVRKKGMRKLLSRGGKAKMKDVSDRAVSDGDEVEIETQKRGKLKLKKSSKVSQSKKGSKTSKTKDKPNIELMKSETATKSSTKSPMKRIRHKLRKTLSKKKNKGSSRGIKLNEVLNSSTTTNETMSQTIFNSNLIVTSRQPKLGSSSSSLKPVMENLFPNTSRGSNLKTSNYSATLPPTDTTSSLTSKSESDTSDEPTSTQSISQETQSGIHLPRSPTDKSNSDVVNSNSSKYENDSVDVPTSTEITSQQKQSITNIESTEGMSLNSCGISEKAPSSDNCLTSSSMLKAIKDKPTLGEGSNDENEVLETSTISIDVVPISNDDANFTTSSVCSVPVFDQMEIIDAIPQSIKATIQDSPASSVFLTKDDEDLLTEKSDQKSNASSVFIAKDDAESTTNCMCSENVDIYQVQVEETLLRLTARASMNDLQTIGKDDTNSAANDQVSRQETVPPLASKCEDDEEDEFLKYYSNLDECGPAKQTLFRYFISCCFSGIEGHKRGLITTIEGHNKGLITNENKLENEISEIPEIPEIPQGNLESLNAGDNHMEN